MLLKSMCLIKDYNYYISYYSQHRRTAHGNFSYRHFRKEKKSGNIRAKPLDFRASNGKKNSGKRFQTPPPPPALDSSRKLTIPKFFNLLVAPENKRKSMVFSFRPTYSIVFLKFEDVLFIYLLTLFSECMSNELLKCISFTYQK